MTSGGPEASPRNAGFGSAPVGDGSWPRRDPEDRSVIEGRLPLPYPGFDACSLLQFDSLDSMDAGFSSDLYREKVVPDEAVLVDKSRFSLFLGDARISSVIPGGTVVLVTLLREQYVSVGAPRTGRQADVADAVDIRAFESPQQALSWLTGEEQGVANDVRMAGLGLVVGRVLARTYEVV